MRLESSTGSQPSRTRRRFVIATAGAMTAWGLSSRSGKAAAQSGQPAVAQRVFDGLSFSAVLCELPAELWLRPAESGRLSVSAEPAVLHALKVSTVAGELRLAASGFQTRAPVLMSLGFATLERLSLQSSGSAVLTALRSHRLALRVGGSSDLLARGLNLSELQLDSSGSGEVRLAGTARLAAMRLTGSGDVHASDLAVEQLTLRSAGSGDAWVDARALTLSLDGSGDVRCKGRPALTRQGQGSGDVKCGG